MSDIGVDEMKAAVVAIDCHRGHLDPEVATMPAPPEVARRLIEANRRFLGQCRERGVPIVHLVTSYRDVAEIRANPFWRTRADDPHATRKNVERHNILTPPESPPRKRLWAGKSSWGRCWFRRSSTES